MKILTPLKAIRKNCLECNGTSNEVKLCPATECLLYLYRFGRRPEGLHKKRIMSDKQKEALKKMLEKGKIMKKTNTNLTP